MTDLLSDVETPSDAELISRVRGGDVAAYGELFSRHKEAANRLARQLVRGPDSDDLVSEAFAKVLTVLQGGGGPDVAFRAYLLTAVRRLHVDRVRSGQRLQTTDDLTPFDPGVPFQDTAVAGFESGAAAKAFASLPERWQLVLWHLEVEGQKPADIAPLLGMSANSVSALAYRAREGLRQAFLTMHISDLTESDCRWVNEHLGAFVRKGLSKRDSGKVQAHLDECRRCTAMYLELNEVNSNLAGIIAPLLLGAAATGYLASSGAGAAGVLGLVSRAKEFVGANTGAVTAAGVAAGVAAAAAVAAVTLGGGGAAPRSNVVADAPTAVTTPAAPDPSLSSARPRRSTSPASPSSPDSTAPTPTLTPAAVLAPVAPTTSAGSPATGSPSGATSDTSAEIPPQDATDGPATTSSVDLSGTTVDDQGVHFKAVGSPSLPPTMTVRLLSDPSGVTFAPSADCDVAADGSSATCSTLSDGGGSKAPAAARMLAPTSYAAELPFDIPAGQQDTDISVTVDVPEGYQVSGGSDSIKPWTSRSADVRLSLDSPVPFSAAGYPVTAHLAGIPAGYRGAVRISLADGAADIVGTTTDGCSLDAGVVTCEQPGNGVVGLTLAPADTTTATAVRLRVSTLTGYRDPSSANNASSTTLLAQPPAPTPEADLSFTGTPASVALDTATSTHTFTGAVTGVPSGYTGKLRFSLTSGAASLVAGDGCTLDAATLVCDGHNGAVRITLRADDTTQDTPVTLAVAPLDGYTDSDQSDNAQSATLLAAPVTAPRTDLSLGAITPAAPVPGTDGRYHVSTILTVNGPVPPAVTFGVSGGATFDAGSACSVASGGTVVTCMAPTSGMVVDLVLDAPTDRTTTATITAGAPGFTESGPGDESRSVTLQPAPAPSYDVRLTGLTPVTPTADTGGAQQFTATLDRDGFPGTVTFELPDGPAGAGFSAPTDPASGTVTFTVTSGSASAHSLAVRADLSGGVTDTAPGSNTATSTWTPHAYDVRLTGLTPVTGTADGSGAQRFTATLDRDGFTGPVTFDLTDGPSNPNLSAPVDPAHGTVTFTVTSASTSAHRVEIRADLSGGFTDTTPGNNTVAATWSPQPQVPPFAFTSAPKASDAKGGEWTVTTTVDGIPSGGSVAFTLAKPSEFVSVTGCTISGDKQTMTCRPGSTGPFTVTFRAKLPGAQGSRHGDLTAGVVGDPTRTATATVTE